MNKVEIYKSIKLLAGHPHTLDWIAYANARYDSKFATTLAERKQLATFKSSIEVVMPWSSHLHYTLERAVAADLGASFVMYDRLVNSLTYLMYDKSYDLIKLIVAMLSSPKRDGAHDIEKPIYELEDEIAPESTVTLFDDDGLTLYTGQVSDIPPYYRRRIAKKKNNLNGTFDLVIV